MKRSIDKSVPTNQFKLLTSCVSENIYSQLKHILTGVIFGFSITVTLCGCNQNTKTDLESDTARAPDSFNEQKREILKRIEAMPAETDADFLAQQLHLERGVILLETINVIGQIGQSKHIPDLIYVLENDAQGKIQSAANSSIDEIIRRQKPKPHYP